MKTEVIELVERYYLDDDLDCSRRSHNKNDVINVKINGVIEQKIKCFLTRSIKEICDLITISRSKIYQLRPKWVLIQPLNNSCLCVYCANFDLIVTALKIVLKKSKSEFLTLKQEILPMIACSIENDSCILRECKICKDITITEENFHLEEDLLFDEISLLQTFLRNKSFRIGGVDIITIIPNLKV